MSKAFLTQLGRELGAIFMSPLAYIIFFFFTLISGIIFYQNITFLEGFGGRFSLAQMFFLGVWFWICLLIMIPLVTMRLFSEEYKTGTIEILLTAPVSDWDVVLAKFFGALAFYLCLWAPSVLYLLIFQWVSDSQVPIQWPSLLLCYSMVVLVGSLFISVGLFFSSLTKSQPLAAFMSFATLMIYFFVGILAFNVHNSKFSDLLSYISTYQHMQTYLEGIFDTRPLVFYLTAAALFLALTHQILAIKKVKA
ncbi:MAG: ABC transporter permease subunit [Verrucomicrobiota bacterium]